MISVLYVESLFHNRKKLKDDGLIDNNLYVDIGDDTIEKIHGEL